MVFYDSIPASGNQVLTDVTQMENNFAYLKSVLQNFCTTWSNSDPSGIAPNLFVRSAKTADYTVTAGDTYLSVSGASSAVTITLEASATAGAGRFVMMKATDITNTVTVDGNGSETIDGSTTFVFTHTDQVICVISNGSNWEILFNSISNIGKNILGQNLLSNSGFGVWSNSDGPYDYGSQITLTDVTSGVCSTADTQDLAVGHLFRFDSGDFIGEIYTVTAITVDTSFNLSDTSLTDSGSPGTGYEVTPGIEGANNLGPDGWSRTSTIKVYREPNGSFTPVGSHYACKTVKGSNDPEYLYQTISNPAELSKYLGKVVTLGAYAYSVTATDNVRLAIYHNGTWETGDLLTTADAYTWLSELNTTIHSSSTEIRVGFCFDGDIGDTAYVACDMFIFGESIGEGNYQLPFEETIVFEDAVNSNALHAVTGNSSVSATELNLMADSNGCIPGNVIEVTIYSRVNDSGSSGGTTLIYTLGKDTGSLSYINDISGLVDDISKRHVGITTVRDGAIVDYAILASGSGTFDVNNFQYLGVKIRG